MVLHVTATRGEFSHTDLFWDEMLATRPPETVRSDSCPDTLGNGAPGGRPCMGAARLLLVLSGERDMMA